MYFYSCFDVYFNSYNLSYQILLLDSNLLTGQARIPDIGIAYLCTGMSGTNRYLVIFWHVKLKQKFRRSYHVITWK